MMRKSLNKNEPEEKEERSCLVPLCAMSCPSEELLKRLWRQANHSDNNLGTYAVGPSPQFITLQSAKKLLSVMKIGPATSFLDVGCGHGLVCFTAKALFNARQSAGIELRPDPLRWADAVILDSIYRSGLLAAVTLAQDDIMNHESINDLWDCVYCFDKEYPPMVRRRLHLWAVTGKRWKRWASSHVWNERQREEAGVRCSYEQVKVKLCGSGQQHTIYVYSRG